MLSKKVVALRAKLGDTAECDVKTQSVSQLVVERKRSRFRHSNSDSSVMAELLVRSIIRGQNSLDCIMEDSSPPQPGVMETANSSKASPPFENILKQKTASEPFLSIPYSSLDAHSSNDSCSDSSSSEEDENQSDSAENSLNFDTVSNIVKNVEIIERKLSLGSKNIDRHRQDQFMFPEQQLIFEPDSVSEFAGPSTDKDSFGEENVNQESSVDNLKPDSVSECASTDNKDSFEEGNEKRKELLPPFAEAESFSIDHSDEEPRRDAEQVKEDLVKPKHDSKLIIPPVMIGANLKSTGLVRTAMQTILLDKVNIMGTYSPPMSPSSVEHHPKSFNLSLPGSNASSPPSGMEESFFSHITKTFENVKRSPTAVSLSEMSSEKQSVLGAPFVSLHNIQCGKSDTSLHLRSRSKPSSAEHLSKTEQHVVPERCGKSEEFIPRSSSETPGETAVEHKALTSLKKVDDLKRTTSVDHLFRKKFGFLHRKGHSENRRRSEEPTVTVEDAKSKSYDRIPDFINSLFHKKYKHNPTMFRHNKGLLGAALQSVAMETVQDILATSHTQEPQKTEKSRFIPFSSSAVLNTTNPIITASKPDLSCNAPANTEIDKGPCVSSNKMHASLTPDLRNQAGSPVKEPPRIEMGHHRTESVGAKMSQSPAKLNSIPCIHRRSSDSDLSITPKGKNYKCLINLGFLFTFQHT